MSQKLLLSVNEYPQFKLISLEQTAKMSKKRLISLLNEGKNSVKSNKIFKLHHKQTISAKSLQIYCITKLNYCM